MGQTVITSHDEVSAFVFPCEGPSKKWSTAWCGRLNLTNKAQFPLEIEGTSRLPRAKEFFYWGFVSDTKGAQCRTNGKHLSMEMCVSVSFTLSP